MSQGNGGTAPTAAASTKEAVTKIPVTMKDGRVLEFTERQKCVTEEDESGLRLNFKTGDFLEVKFQELEPLKQRFFVHGVRQKYQDEFASAKDPGDAFEWVSDMHSRLVKGDWREPAQGGGVSGAGLLVQAMMELHDMTRDAVKEFLKDKSRKEQEILRDYGPIKAKIDEIKARKPQRDTSAEAQALLAGIPAKAA